MLATNPTLRAHVYTWAYRLLRNHHDALDATQEVLLRTLRQPAGEVRNPTAWLRRVTVNHCLDVVRARRAELKPATDAIDNDDAVRAAIAGELHDAILDGLAKLSERQRAVIVAKVYDQETFAAIAESMGLTIPTVKTHCLRALRALRRSLGPHAEDWS